MGKNISTVLIGIVILFGLFYLVLAPSNFKLYVEFMEIAVPLLAIQMGAIGFGNWNKGKFQPTETPSAPIESETKL